MLCGEIIAVFFNIHTNNINTPATNEPYGIKLYLAAVTHSVIWEVLYKA